jgi:outer membrane protein OmpA-like peptidoglycan-associated protein
MRILASLLLSALAASACARSQPPTSPSVGLTQAINPPRPPDLGHYPSRTEYGQLYRIYIGEPVRTICSGPAPFFEFDSDKTTPSDQPTMQTLVECMISGPLHGKSIVLIGHTDPRGTAAYNAKLGLERAERVKKYLVTNGVETGRVLTETHGLQGASADEKDWPLDRRVAVELAP